jgi:ribosomal protein S18
VYPSVFIFSLSGVMHKVNYCNQKILSRRFVSEEFRIYPNVR